VRGGNERGLAEPTWITWTNAMSDATTPVAALKDGIRRFAAERDWDPYHNPKNLTMALASEVGELCDVFRWLTPAESAAAPGDPKLREAIADELADVANIVFLLSEHTGIDLSEAIRAKMAKNRIKYPAPAKPAGAE
jgi:NTP pyrophosphatase (non-canonical NTP hydrolase)